MRSATYASIDVDRSGGPSNQIDHVPSSRMRAISSFAMPPVEVGRAQPEHVVPEEVLRRHRHVRLELADPDAVGPLQLEQAARAAVDRLVEGASAPRSRVMR